MSDLLKFNFIYLGGIIKDDLYKYLNKIETNFYLLIASSKQEYNYMINSDYRYNRFDVVTTGSPRFDNLKKLEKRIKKEKIILIYPTFRLNIKGIRNLLTFNSIRAENFKNTNYYYNKKKLNILIQYDYNKFVLNIDSISNCDDALKVHRKNFSSIKKNFLLGIIAKYNWETILPFIKSLIKSKFDNCDIVMFVSEVKFDVIDNLQSFGIIVFKIKEN